MSRPSLGEASDEMTGSQFITPALQDVEKETLTVDETPLHDDQKDDVPWEPSVKRAPARHEPTPESSAGPGTS